MAGNNLLISRSVPFGQNYSLRCLLMPCDMPCDISAFCPGVKPYVFRKKRLVCPCRMHQVLQCLLLLPLALTIGALSNTTRASLQ